MRSSDTLSLATSKPVPLEEDEQIALFRWAAWQANSTPELRLLYHVPNGGSRHKAEAARLKAAGVKSGVPDICLPVPRAGYHGLYIELKRQKGGRISPEQTEWIAALIKQGYCAAVCRGWEAAREEILRYLTISKEEKK